MYAVVCSQSTHKKWTRAQTTLLRKYEAKWPAKVKEVVYKDDDIFSALPQLSELQPTYTCFLTHYSECSKTFVQSVHKLTRELDPTTPYTDTVWGVLTGWEEEDCLRMIQTEPLTIEGVTGNCPIPLDKFTTGVSYSEVEQSVASRKQLAEGTINQCVCPADITETLILEMGAPHSDDKTGVDMIITSAHATETELKLGYSFKSGKLVCSEGHIHGKSLNGRWHKLHRHDNTPTILSAAGNCLMGLIRDRGSMALAWIHSANVCQLVGYVVPTWYGYGGWGVHKYFINNPGGMTFAQAYFANQQSLLARLNSLKTPALAVKKHEDVYRANFGAEKIDSHELSGLSYDQDTTVFYGDPAWEAKLALKSELWDYSSVVSAWTPLVEDSEPNWSYWEFTVRTLRSGSWDCPVADDKSTSPGRPPLYVFPSRVVGAKLVAGDAIVTSSFVMMMLEGQFDAGQVHIVQFATTS